MRLTQEEHLRPCDLLPDIESDAGTCPSGSSQALFLSDGEGLPEGIVEAELRPIREVLMLMGMESEELISSFHQLKARHS